MVLQSTDRPSPELEDELARLVWARMDNLRDPDLVPFLRQSLPSLRRALDGADGDRQVETLSYMEAKKVRCAASVVA